CVCVCVCVYIYTCARPLCFVCQVKKVNKWSCKLCGEKQSLLKEFGRGSGADCRRQVQKLNALRGAVMENRQDRVAGANT
uniref:MRN complex-interacting protein N-terminal domain-containing protein n=1 Tax=Cyclopterus lumpus TaxID=8103 RepID=A0A8C2Z0M5_CYCLU